MIGKKPGLGPDTGESTSVIGENSSFDGTFEVTGNLRVDGTFKGEINVSETLVVGKHGQVDADVKTRSAVVAGTIKATHGNETSFRRGRPDAGFFKSSRSRVCCSQVSPGYSLHQCFLPPSASTNASRSWGTPGCALVLR